MEAVGTVIVVAVAIVQTAVEFTALALDDLRPWLDRAADFGARLRDGKR